MQASVLRAYLRRLTNLETGNKAILLPRLSAEQDLDICDLDFLNGKPAFDTIARLLADARPVKLIDIHDPRDENVNKVSARLKKISRRAAMIEEETGSRDLMLAWPFVRGRFPDGTAVHAPLLFFPVDLSVDNGKWQITRRAQDPAAFNKSFVLAYAHYGGAASPAEDLLEYAYDGAERDATALLTTLYRMLEESSINLNFNSATFENKLAPFTAKTRAEIEEEYAPGILKLDSEAVLGIFPQTDSYMLPDYEYLLNAENGDDVEGIFGSLVPEFPLPVREEDTYTVLPLDAAQEKALNSVKAGDSPVVQGPPGTGKSQLIANLIADFAARGKRVLLVCQKRAALDVVHERLGRLGMGDFMALIHDFRADRKDLYERLARQIAGIDEAKMANSSLNSIHLDRDFNRLSRQIESSAENLERYKAALFDDSVCGISAKELYLNSNPAAPHGNFSPVSQSFRPAESSDFLRRLGYYYDYSILLNKPERLWHVSNFDKVNSTAPLKQALNVTLPELKAALEPFGSREEAFEIHKSAELLSRLLEVSNAGYLVFQTQIPQVKTARAAHDALSIIDAAEAQINLAFSEPGVDWQSNKENLPILLKQVKNAAAVDKGFLAQTFYYTFNAESKFVKQQLGMRGMGTKEVDTLLAMLENRHRLEVAIADVSNMPGFPQGEFTLAQFTDWADTMRQALQLSIRNMQAPKALVPLLNYKELSLHEARKHLQFLLGSAQKASGLFNALKENFNYNQIEYLLRGPVDPAAEISFLELHSDSFFAFNRLIKDFSSEEADAVYELEALIPGKPNIELQGTHSEQHFYGQATTKAGYLAAFTNSLNLAWLNHIEEQYPVLRSSGSMQLEQWQSELQQSILEKRGLSSRMLLMRLRERSYANLEYNRLQNRTTFRDLEHQVTKKRRIWPIRKLVSELGEEVFRLVPCWMASPEAVSALFPMEKIFDLVIFDEASQCYAEKGIPAIFRGRQVLIAGDDKQLQPNNLYTARFEDPGDDSPDAEADSLLKLAGRYLPRTMLQGHYRSRLPELIGFSNKHFYRGRLRVLPDYEDMNRHGTAITYLKTNGIWEQNCNVAEADAVLNLLKSLKARPETANKSVGIVTFNAPQQYLIMELLEENGFSPNVSDIGLAESDPQQEYLFVKNIENVQGDERDIIIFSIAYAPDIKGKLSARFGSLNMPGGENRLNVAVTRAREKIFVITSILPHQLSTEGAKHSGPQMLKEYLAYALAVSEGQRETSESSDNARSHTVLLKDLLADQHPELSPLLPFADLTLTDTGDYKGLVLTDDELYHHSLSARDAHAYTPFALAAKRWPFLQLHSREQWARPAVLREKTEAFIKKNMGL